VHRGAIRVLTAVVAACVWHAAAASAAVQPVSRVREMAKVAPNTPVTVRGVVTRYRSGRSIYVEDQTGSIFVYTDGTAPLEPGDVVTVTGDADTENNLPIINKATYQKVGRTDRPQPIGVSVRQLALGQYDAQLVSLEGTLVRTDGTREEEAFIVRADDIEFSVWVLNTAVGNARSIAPGSRVQVTGIASIRMVDRQPQGFEILGRSGADVALLQAPSWWTRRRLNSAAIGLAAVIVLLLSYVFLLRRQVERQTAAIRERLRAEAELKEQYRQAQKTEALGRLAGGIAHDFNNIMTIVLGHVDVLAAELKERPELMESIKELRLAAARAAAVTRQLLAFGRRQRLQPGPVDLNEVVDGMGTLFARVLGGDVAVNVELAAGPVTIQADRPQLEQALLNLTVNARDAMPDGGLLTISVSRRQDDQGQLVGVLTVADTGDGIPEDVLPHIFDPFFTTKNVGEGSGLGLAMVYGFVQQSGGGITVDSRAGAGATFELTFPLQTQKLDAKAT